MTSDGACSDVVPECVAAPEPQMTREEYLAERASKIALMEKQGEFLDKSLLTLAAGALGLTLTFLRDHGLTAPSTDCATAAAC